MARSSASTLINMDAEEQNADLEEFVGYNLKRAYVVVSSDFRRVMGEDGFAPRQFSALSLIVQFPNITQSELARKLGIERSGLVSIVDELEGRGLVSRLAVPGDRRVQALAPTKAGRQAYSKARDMVRDHEATLLAGLSDKEIETLVGLLRRIRSIED